MKSYEEIEIFLVIQRTAIQPSPWFRLLIGMTSPHRRPMRCCFISQLPETETESEHPQNRNRKTLIRQICLKKLLKTYQGHVLLSLFRVGKCQQYGEIAGTLFVLRLWSAGQSLYPIFIRMRKWGTCGQNFGDSNRCGWQCGQTWKLVTALICELSADVS